MRASPAVTVVMSFTILQGMDILTGMHRSGTSLVARLFLEAGADLGDTNSFYRPDRWNPGGYFEQPEIHAINMPLINGPWGKFTYFRLPSTQKIIARARRRSRQIAHTAARYEAGLVKDTRFCLTLPAWLACGAAVDRIVICLRHPGAIAASLRRRNFAPAAFAYRLWQAHLERLIEHSSGLSRWFVRYERIVDPALFRDELVPALRFLGQHAGDEDLRRWQGEIVKPHWNHHDGDFHDEPSSVKQLWQELLDLHASQGTECAPSVSDTPR